MHRELEPALCAEIIRKSRSIVALTGAGISTAAGIPDFRGASGLYVTRRYDPEKTFNIDGFRSDPNCFYEFSRDLVGMVKNIHPTFTHRFLAHLEKEGRLTGTVTQNIDMLHQMAGNRMVIELHGSYRTATCLACRRKYRELTYDWWDKAINDSPDTPVAFCTSCNGVIKPDIVFFGEMVKGYAEAERRVMECDLLLVLGSSLQVSPASFLPYETDAATIIVNRGEVLLPAAPHRFFVNQDLDAYFHQVARHLSNSPA